MGLLRLHLSYCMEQARLAERGFDPYWILLSKESFDPPTCRYPTKNLELTQTVGWEGFGQHQKGVIVGIREVRILIQWRKSLRKLCKIAFCSNDASLYLFPNASQGKYHYGRKTIPAQQASLTFDFTEDIFQEQIPKLSIHETGQVHVSVGTQRAGPLFIPPLARLRGEHVASVSPDAFETLPMFTGMLRDNGSEVDHIIPALDEATNGTLAIYVNGRKPAFAESNCRLTFELTRSTIDRPLYIGMKPKGQPQIGVNTRKGVTIIAGWNPLQSTVEEADFLYIRGE